MIKWTSDIKALIQPGQVSNKPTKRYLVSGHIEGWTAQYFNGPHKGVPVSGLEGYFMVGASYARAACEQHSADNP